MVWINLVSDSQCDEAAPKYFLNWAVSGTVEIKMGKHVTNCNLKHHLMRDWHLCIEAKGSCTKTLACPVWFVVYTPQSSPPVGGEHLCSALNTFQCSMHCTGVTVSSTLKDGFKNILF